MRTEPVTVPGIFLQTVEHLGSAIAMRSKQRGVWKEITWTEYRDQVDVLHQGLKRLGVSRGDVVAILSNNRPEWLYIDLACQCAGALPLGLYTESLEDELEYLMNHNRVRFVILEDQEQTDKVLNVLDKLPTLEKAIVIDWEGMEEYDHPLLTRYRDVEEAGSRSLPEHRGDLEHDVARLRASDTAFLSLTAGTEGYPKTVILTHQAVLALAETFLNIEHYGTADELMSCVPLPWIAERCFSMILHVKAGYRVNFPESTQVKVLFQNLREICPSILNCTTSVWERLCAFVYVRHENASRLKQSIFKRFMPVAGRVARRTFNKEGVPLWLAFLNLLGDILLYRKIRERLGLRLLRCAYTGGTATGPEVYAFYHMIGIDIRQLYSLTEIGGIGFGQYPGESNPETTGKPFPGLELKVSTSGEILMHAPYFAGYYNDTESAAKVYKNGWLSTGDCGFIDDRGCVVVLGRQAETIETTTGHKIQPELIENRLKFSPYIKEAIAVGRGRPYVAALIQIDRESVGAWAQRRGIPYTTFRDLAAKPEVIELTGQAVEMVNQTLNEPSRIRRYDLLQKELDSDEGELTRTHKLRRGFIEAKYKDLIDSMYTSCAAPCTGPAQPVYTPSTRILRTQ